MDTNTISQNLGTFFTIFMSLAVTVVGAVKAWSLINHRIKFLEAADERSGKNYDRLVARVERFIEEEDESRSHILESVYQLTTAVRGIDGFNGLVGRVRQIDERSLINEQNVSAITAKFDMYREMNKENREHNSRKGDPK